MRFLLCFFIVSLFCASLFAQAPVAHPLGLILNDEVYKLSPRLALKGGARAVITQPVVSLLPYAPYAGDQGQCSSCVGWAVGYNALSIAWALKKEYTSRAAITTKAFSPGWLYGNISQACAGGSDLVEALTILKNAGDCYQNDFPNVSFDKNYLNQFKSKAYPHHVKDFVALFAIDADADEKLEQTKLSLYNRKPVIIAANVDAAFERLTQWQPIWHPDYNEKAIGAHAMCVAGYNDFEKTFTILNSWGRNWGSDGCFKITYDDFAKVVKYGFQITIDDRNNPQNDPVMVKGDFRLEQITSYDSVTNKITSEEKETLLNGNIYELNNGATKDDFFRLFAKNIRSDCYVYVFSIDPANRAEVLYPFSKNSNFANQYKLGATVVEVPRAYAADIIEIPGQQKAFQTDVVGNDYMCILFSYNQINNIDLIAGFVRDSPASDFMDRLKDALGNRLINIADLKYNRHAMSVSGTSNQGDVVPIILKINVK